MKGTIFTIDCQYVYPEFAASYLITEGNKAAIVETGTNPSVPHILKKLDELGIDRSAVEYIIITHVHLDHAGGCAQLMNLCANATLLAHPRAVPHIIDPSKLVSSARQVYGDNVFDLLYGQIDGVDPTRVRALDDGVSKKLGTRELVFLHTRGHANHHFCIFDTLENAVFTGDSFGLCYPRLQKDGFFILPSTSPTDFEPREAKNAIHKILATGATTLYPTHFGAVTDVKAAAMQMLEHLDFAQKLFERAVATNVTGIDLVNTCKEQSREYLEEYLQKHNLHFSKEDWEFLDPDLRLNAAGIAHSAIKTRIKRN